MSFLNSPITRDQRGSPAREKRYYSIRDTETSIYPREDTNHLLLDGEHYKANGWFPE